MKVIGKVENGKLLFIEKPDFSKYEGKKVKIEVKKLYNQRSIAANKYYWSVLIVAMGEAMGERDKNYIHYLFKETFLNRVTDQGNVFVQSTSNLNVKEFWKYCQDCERLIYENGGTIDELESKTMREIMNETNKAYKNEKKRLE